MVRLRVRPMKVLTKMYVCVCFSSFNSRSFLFDQFIIMTIFSVSSRTWAVKGRLMFHLLANDASFVHLSYITSPNC